MPTDSRYNVSGSIFDKSSDIPLVAGLQEEYDGNSPVPIVAGALPIKEGVAYGVPYYVSMATVIGRGVDKNSKAAQRLESRRIDIKSEAAYVRDAQSKLQRMYIPNEVTTRVTKHPKLHDLKLERRASFLESYANNANLSVSPLSEIKSGIGLGSREIIGRTDSMIRDNDDLGAQVTGGTIESAVLAGGVFKTYQDLSPIAVKAAVNAPDFLIKTGKNTFDVVSTVGRTTVAIGNTIGIAGGIGIATGVPVGLSVHWDILKEQVISTGLKDTMMSQNIVAEVKRIQHGLGTAKTNVVNAYKDTVATVRKIGDGAKRTFEVTQGIVNGTTKMSTVVFKSLTATKNYVKKHHMPALRGSVRNLTKGGTWVAVKGIPKSIDMAGSLGLGAGAMLAQADNTTLQGVGASLQIGVHGVKTSVTAGKITGYTVKTAYKSTVAAGNAAWYAGLYVRRHGIVAASKAAGAKIGTGISNAGRSVISAIINVAKSAGTKVIMPLLLIVMTIVVGANLITAPLSIVGAIFGNTFSTVDADGIYKDYEIREFITDPEFGLPVMRSAYISELESSLSGSYINNGGEYHIVRLYTNLMGTSAVGNTWADIDSVFISMPVLADIVHPIYNAVILMEYDLQPTEDEAIVLLQSIFDKLVYTTRSSHIEYCGEDIATGEGEPDTHTCGIIHAHSDCPHSISGRHVIYACDICCSQTCPGHEYYCSGEMCDSDVCAGHTSYCSGADCSHECEGYEECNSHNTLHVTLTLDGVYSLLNYYFLEPIDALLNLATRTEEEERQLSELKDYYEICLEYMSNISIVYGGGITLSDLSHVDWINGTRTGRQDIVDLALSQVGQVGGQPYWSYMGFESRVAWCAAFVYWSYHHAGYGSIFPPHGYTAGTVNCAYCPSLVSYFRSTGQWGDNTFTNLVAGDIIFFSWNMNGVADHVGIVIGRDAEMVYYVDGNSGDSVKSQARLLNSGVILGYGIL